MIKRVLVTGILVLFLSGVAFGSTFTDTVDLDVTLSEGVIASLFVDGYYMYTHNTPVDFEVPWDNVNSATLTIDAYWVDGGNDPVYVEGAFVGNLVTGGDYQDAGWNWNWGWYYTPGYDSPATSTFNIASAFSAWNTGDLLNVGIQATQDNWYDFEGCLTLGSSTFYLDYDNNTAPVPEPATLVLLGSGLAGLAFYRRKRK